MDETKTLIADITQCMDFERKPRATKQEKEDYVALREAVADIKRDIDKLNLRLWHACYKNDYHSFLKEEAMRQLQRIRMDIDEILGCCEREK